MSYPIKDGAGNVLSSSRVIAQGTFTATGTSSVIEVGKAPFYIELWGTFTATVNLEKSNDGTNWRTKKSYTAADEEIYDNVDQRSLFRLNCAAFTSGTVNYRIVAGE